jgi:hypothetical protein
MQAAEEFGPSHIGQRPVEQHDIRSEHDNLFERLNAVTRFVNLRAVQGEQQALNDFAHPILVVDDQDLGLSERTFLSRGENHPGTPIQLQLSWLSNHFRVRAGCKWMLKFYSNYLRTPQLMVKTNYEHVEAG